MFKVAALGVALLATSGGQADAGPSAPLGRVAVAQGGDESRLVILNPDGSGTRTLVRREFGLRSPAWRPDGRALAFVSSRAGRPGLYLVNDD